MGEPLTRPAPGTALRVGLVGAGTISSQYLHYLHAHGPATGLRLTAVADQVHERATALAGRHPEVRALSVPELCADDGVDIVLNLTVPAAHAPVALAAIAGGKHVYGEKPLAADRADAVRILSAAREAGVRVGCAPDTVLGPGVQTARAAVDQGLIGRPLTATAAFTSAGHEAWHPAPQFYYQDGAGPLLDMGPYYLTALIHLLGPVESVTARSRRSSSHRTVATGPQAGTVFPVRVDTHVTALLRHHYGALTTLLMSFDTPASRIPPIEVHGSDGSLSVPDPNHFHGSAEIHATGPHQGWRTLPPLPAATHPGRGLGLAEMADAIRTGRPHRADGDLAFHVLDVMSCVLESAAADRPTVPRSTCKRPAPMTPGAPDPRA